MGFEGQVVRGNCRLCRKVALILIAVRPISEEEVCTCTYRQDMSDECVYVESIILESEKLHA